MGDLQIGFLCDIEGFDYVEAQFLFDDGCNSSKGMGWEEILEEGHDLVIGGVEEAEPLKHSGENSWREIGWSEISWHLLIDSLVVHFNESGNGDQILSELVKHFEFWVDTFADLLELRLHTCSGKVTESF